MVGPPTKFRSLNMSFFKRLFGLESNAERIARELLGPEGDRHLARVEREIQMAVADPVIRQLMREIGLTEEHIRDVHRRLGALGHPELSARAIRNPELLRWFYNNGGKELQLDLGQAMKLVFFAERGHL